MDIIIAEMWLGIVVLLLTMFLILVGFFEGLKR